MTGLRLHFNMLQHFVSLLLSGPINRYGLCETRSLRGHIILLVIKISCPIGEKLRNYKMLTFITRRRRLCPSVEKKRKITSTTFFYIFFTSIMEYDTCKFSDFNIRIKLLTTVLDKVVTSHATRCIERPSPKF